MYTPYHSLYWANALTLQTGAESIERLSQSIASARVDLNPHQVDAALSALRSPLSKGMILADEVGLGKTIEAALVIAQRWAERRRRILLILPATLRKQWQQELLDKFNLPCLILETRSYNEALKSGNPNPFLVQDRLVVCSYQFAAARQTDIASIPWDLVVLDEAHRLRNIFKGTNKTAAAIAEALHGRHKLLLTATPLQNSLMELYGLVSIIDPQVFGDARSFRLQYVQVNNETQRNLVLRERLKPLCKRTLRRQVQEYVRFTRRIPITQDFFPTVSEQKLYSEVSEYLRRPELMALPASQRQLITLVLRKLLASSSFAISGTLRNLARRLETELESSPRPASADADAAIEATSDFDSIEELADEWDADSSAENPSAPAPDPTALRNHKIRAEIRDLKGFVTLAESIHRNSKGEQLLDGLKQAFQKAVQLGAPRKAVIFTESLRTQRYLFDLLTQNGYQDQIVLISGTNAGPESAAICRQWFERNKGTDRISGSRSADMKAAIVEEFRDRATILIATESAAEGVNLQFCALVVNYDLPWNPQRVEQRIGRCHRYGQQHDVVVVNFVNRSNAADQRVFQLLSEKFRLFDGVFGASDEVLGAIESGVDLEKRIAAVYQECRTNSEIDGAFNQLQLELDGDIANRLAQTRRDLLEHFDEDVHHRFRIHRERAQETLSSIQRTLLNLSRQELGPSATFAASEPYFDFAGAGYHMDWRIAEERKCHFYRPDHPLAEKIIMEAKARPLPPAEIVFNYGQYGARVGVLEPLIGQAGWLRVALLRVQSFETEERLIFAGTIGLLACRRAEGARADSPAIPDPSGLGPSGVGLPSCARAEGADLPAALHPDICRKILALPGAIAESPLTCVPPATLDDSLNIETANALAEVEQRNLKYFDEEVQKLDRWAEDLKTALEREIKAIDQEIREVKRLSTAAPSLHEKLDFQKRLKELDADRRSKRKRLFDAQDEIDAKRDALIAAIEQRLQQKVFCQSLMTIRWRIADAGNGNG